MRGTTSALRIIFGKGLGTAWKDEWVHPVNGRPFHIFDGFALVNRLLCSASPPQSSQRRPTGTMLANCRVHLQATLRILEPALVVLQAGFVARSVATALPVVRRHGEYLYASSCTQSRALVCTQVRLLPGVRRPALGRFRQNAWGVAMSRAAGGLTASQASSGQVLQADAGAVSADPSEAVTVRSP